MRHKVRGENNFTVCTEESEGRGEARSFKPVSFCYPGPKHLFAAIFASLVAIPSLAMDEVNDCLRLEKADNGGAFTVDVGQRVEVQLPGEPHDTIRSWQVRSIEYLSGPRCTVTADEVGGARIDPADPTKGLNYTVRLKTAYPGRADITLAYFEEATPVVKDQDDANSPDRTFEFRLTVERTDDFEPLTDQRLEIDPLPLSVMLGNELGGDWQAGNHVVCTRPKRGGSFYVHHAGMQDEQMEVLRSVIMWTRPMAIIWAGNGWTVLGDSHAWTSDRAKVTKLMEILSRFRPHHATWKMPRRLPAETGKQEGGASK